MTKSDSVSGSVRAPATRSSRLAETNLVSPRFFSARLLVNEVKKEIQLEITLDSRQPT